MSPGAQPVGVPAVYSHLPPFQLSLFRGFWLGGQWRLAAANATQKTSGVTPDNKILIVILIVANMTPTTATVIDLRNRRA